MTLKAQEEIYEAISNPFFPLNQQTNCCWVLGIYSGLTSETNVEGVFHPDLTVQTILRKKKNIHKPSHNS